MKQKTSILLCVVAVFAALIPLFSSQAKNQLTIVSYNIRHGEGIDGKTDYARIARIFTEQEADVVAVQEVDSVTGRSRGNDVLQELAEAAGMHPTFARAIAFDGGAYGIGILSKEAPLSVQRIPLPGREEARVLIVAEFERFFFGCTHLSLTPEDQLASLPVIRQAASAMKKPFILAGDWNAVPTEPFIQEIQQDVTLLNDLTQPTWPSDVPETMIDYIGVWKTTGPHIKATHTAVLPYSVSSDHRPVVVKVEGL